MKPEEYDSIAAAYQEIYSEATAMAKRGYDEAPIRKQIAANTKGGEAADRATKLADKSTFGDTNKEKQRQRLARTQRGDFRKTTSSSPGLHGYAHQSNDPKVKEKQAARGAQRSALTPNERKQLNMGDESFNIDMIEYLMVEGYADTNEAAFAILANMSEEWKQSIIEGRRTSLSALSRESQQRKADKERGRPETEDEKHRRLRLGRYAPSQYNYEKDANGNWRVTGRKDGEKD